MIDGSGHTYDGPFIFWDGCGYPDPGGETTGPPQLPQDTQIVTAKTLP